MFIRLGSILKTAHTRPGKGVPLYALQVRQVGQEILDKVCIEYPEEVAKKVKVKTFKNGTLTVVSPQLLSAELHTRSEGLKEDINRALKKNLVEKIRFKVG